MQCEYYLFLVRDTTAKNAHGPTAEVEYLCTSRIRTALKEVSPKLSVCPGIGAMRACLPPFKVTWVIYVYPAPREAVAKGLREDMVRM